MEFQRAATVEANAYVAYPATVKFCHPDCEPPVVGALLFFASMLPDDLGEPAEHAPHEHAMLWHKETGAWVLSPS